MLYDCHVLGGVRLVMFQATPISHPLVTVSKGNERSDLLICWGGRKTCSFVTKPIHVSMLR